MITPIDWISSIILLLTCTGILIIQVQIILSVQDVCKQFVSISERLLTYLEQQSKRGGL